MCQLDPSPILSRRSFLALGGVAAAGVILPGCGGRGGGDAEEQQDFFTASNVVVKPEVVVLPSDGSVTIGSVTDTSVTLTGAAPTLLPGAVIVSGDGAGFMRRVTSVTPAGSSVVLATEGASLTDVFESATVSFRRGLNATDPSTDQLLLPGVQVTPQTRARASTASSFRVFIPKTLVGAEAGVTSGGVELEADGTISLILEGDIEIVPSGIKRVEIRQAAGWVGSYKATLKGELKPFKREMPYFVKIFSPIPLGSIGPVPIVLLPVLSIQLATIVTLAAGWEISGNGKAGYVLGGRLAPPSPTPSPALSDFTGIASGSVTGTFSGPSFFSSVKAEIIPWQLELATSLDGLIGPTFKADLPAGIAELKHFPNALDPKFGQSDARIDLALRGKIGAKAGLFKLGLPLFEVTVADKRFPVFDHPYKPGSSGVGVK
jgi:hypothetical protein